MVAQRESVLLGDRALPFFNDIVDEFLDPPAMHANDVVMMRATFQLEHGLSALEVVPGDQSRRLELGEGAIYGGQPDLLSGIEQFSVDGFGREVQAFDVLEKLEYLEPGQGGFQAGILQMFRLVHTVTLQMSRNSSCQKVVANANENDYHSQTYWRFAMKRLLLLTLLLPLGAFAIGLFLFTLLLPLTAQAADGGNLSADYKLVIKDHRFQPAELTIPSGAKIKLAIINQDATPEEFDSHALNREKMVSGNNSAIVYIGPLAPGRYPFTGEFHSDTAQGVIIAQ
jgi:hypothetical protein